MADTENKEEKMVWSWEVVERVYNTSKVNISSLNLHDMVNTSPACQRAMVNEYRGFKGMAPVDTAVRVDGKEVDEVIASFFGLAIQTAGESKKPDSGAISPTST